METTNDMKKLDHKTLTKSFHRWFWGALTCFSQEHMQTFGYMSSMLPILRKLYPKHDDQVQAIQAYTAFFNTNPMLGTVIVGITASMEQARANGKEDDDKNQVASNSTNNTDVTKPVTTSDSDKAIVNLNTTSPTSNEQAKSSVGQSQTDQSTSSTTNATKATTTVAVDNSAKATTPDISQNDQYDEQYRNQFHYSSNENWINDPNGLFYDSSTGLYNLYYQYNPKGNQWGNMSWGHAVSKDLINWTQEDVAIPWLENQGWEDFTYTNTTGNLKDYGEVRYVGAPTGDWGTTPNSKAIFSGSIVVDTNNVSGLGKGAILAFYTA
ncbi:PTS system mannose/fructose/sorbose family transporter subunit IID, partial [Lacticaseibacillus paracasei]|uniref:PTS system mannose/fructose/sorbose family transporter subunit IID n=1 Tax=Lacticaseibacillus paracasei TaxID=1597 RepID=UPI0033954A49